MTENYYDVLLGFSNEEETITSEGTKLYSVKEVADFIHTHNGGYITEKDGTPLLEIIYGDWLSEEDVADLYPDLDDSSYDVTDEGPYFVFCTDMRYKYELMEQLRKGEGFEARYRY